MSLSLGETWVVSPEDRHRIRMRFWIVFLIYAVGYVFGLRLLDHFFPGARKGPYESFISAIVMVPFLLLQQRFGPGFKAEAKRRSMRVEVDGERYVQFGSAGRRSLQRSEIVEAQRTPTGGLWLITRLRHRRIEVPADFPDMQFLRTLLRDDGVREEPPSRWIESYLLPTMLMWACSVTGAMAILLGAHPRAIEIGWTVFTATLGLQMVRTRQGTVSIERGCNFVTLSIVITLMSVVAGFRVFGR
jgi:hypothetical protein